MQRWLSGMSAVGVLLLVGCGGSSTSESSDESTSASLVSTDGAVPADAVTLTFTVEPMTCEGCVAAINAAVEDVDGVHSVACDLETKQATIVCDSAKRADLIIAALKDRARTATPVAN